jgi:hypothetical protein
MPPRQPAGLSRPAERLGRHPRWKLLLAGSRRAHRKGADAVSNSCPCRPAAAGARIVPVARSLARRREYTGPPGMHRLGGGQVVASVRWLRALCWALVVLAVISAVVSLLFATGVLRPPHDVEDLVERLIANRTSDAEAFPFVVVGSLATIGVFLVAALLGVALRSWAPRIPQRDAMAMLFVIGAVLGIGANLLNIAVGNAATFGYCDCGYKTEEVIGQNYALMVGWTMVNWLTLGALSLVGSGVALAGRLVEISPAWRTVAYVAAVALFAVVALRVLAEFVFIGAFDPFQVSDMILAFAAGVLVPVWAVLLARGAASPEPDVAPA